MGSLALSAAVASGFERSDEAEVFDRRNIERYGFSLAGDTNPGPDWGEIDPDEGAWVGGLWLFEAVDDHGSELQRTDGTKGGTGLVRDLAPGSDDGRPEHLTRFENSAYFTDVRNTLWRSDGTRAGTRRLAKPQPDTYEIKQMLAGRRLLYFVAAEPGEGDEIWRTDGTAEGTLRVVDSKRGDLRLIGEVDGRMVFGERWSDGEGRPTGRVLTTDGSRLGVRQLDRVLGFTGSSVPGGVVFSGSKDGSEESMRTYLTDGTASGTRPLVDATGRELRLCPRRCNAIKVGRDGFVSAFDADGELDIWKVSREGRLSSFWNAGDAATSISELVRTRRGFAFAAGKETTGSRLWISDGTIAGTSSLGPEAFGDSDSPLRIRQLAAIGRGVAIEVGNDSGTRSAELWTSRGSARTTRRVEMGPGASYVGDFLASRGDLVLLEGADARHGVELWKISPQR